MKSFRIVEKMYPKENLVFLTFLFLILQFKVNSQVIVAGKVIDLRGKAVEGAQITAHDKRNPVKLINYTFTDKDGNFKFAINATCDSLIVKVRCLGFKEAYAEISNHAEFLNFTLEEDLLQIDEVVVKSKPIKVEGDTIKYLVSSFTRPNDKVIADVIRNMPGFSVDSKGAVYYEGKPIQKYYIEGLDLLEHNYSVANNNMPHQAVGSIEVLKNHQPIKLLEGIVPSENVSINLKLKRDVVLTGNSNFGGGYEPIQYDINITPMVFKKQNQLLFSFQANNAGKELESQHNVIEFSNNTLSFNSLQYFNSFVDVSKVSPPSIEQNRWLQNNSKLLSYKQLFLLKNDYELKLDVGYYSDISSREGFSIKNYFVNDSSSTFNEGIKNRFYTNSLSLQFRIKRNTKNQFLLSKTSFLGKFNSNHSNIRTDSSVYQRALTPYWSLSSENELIARKENRFSKVGFSFYAYGTNQSLLINPGPFSNILNQGASYDELIQNVHLEKYSFSSYYSKVYSFKPFVVDFKPELYFERGAFNTDILKDNEVLNSDSTFNNKNWSMLNPILSNSVSYERNNFYFSLNVPIKYRLLLANDQVTKQKESSSNQFIEPSIFFRYNLSSKWKLNGNYGYSLNFAKPEDKKTGYIIKSNTLISLDNHSLDISKSNRFGGKITYSDVLRGLSYNASFYTRITRYQEVLEPYLLAKNIISYRVKPISNTATMTKMSTDLSWLISKIFTTLSVKIEFIGETKKMLAKEQLTSVLRKSNNFTFGFNSTVVKDFEFDYKFKITTSTTTLPAKSFQMDGNSNYFSILYFSGKNLYFGAESEYYIFKNNGDRTGSAFFINFYISKKFQKGRYELSLNCQNLLNSQRFETFFESSTLVESSFILLRPRSFFVTLTMPLITGK